MEYGLPPEQRGQKGKKFIGVRCELCSIYFRVYFNEERIGYYGYCPTCHRKVNVKVDPEKGVDARFFKLKI